MWTEHRLVSFDETPLFYHRLRVPGAKAQVILQHGMGEHGGRYRHVAEYLAALGIESAVPDLRGFGQSGGKRACVRSFSDFHGDLAALHTHLARQSALPLFLIGHSFGGLVASSYLAFYSQISPVRGLALSSPIFGIAVPVPPWRHALGMTLSYLFPDHTQGTRVDASKLTHDPLMLRAYAQDKFIRQIISARLYRELVRMIVRRAEIAHSLKVPALVLQADQDFIVSREMTVMFYNELASLDKQLQIYPSFYHEILNETGRQDVLARLGDWILKRC